MINIEMARDYLVRARRCLREAELAYREGDAPSTVRRAEECLELASRSLLRLLGVEYPKVHDVSDVLLEVREKLPSPLRERVGELAQLVAELSSVRGPAFYGYEREGIPASKAFTARYAGEVLEKVRAFYALLEDAVVGLKRTESS